MRKLLLLPILALGACQAGSDALTTAGVAPATAQTIATDTAVAGQLFCADGPTLLAVAGVTVTGATSTSIAQACAVAVAVGAATPPATTPVPVSAPAGAQAVLAAVPVAVAAAVAASKSGS